MKSIKTYLIVLVMFACPLCVNGQAQIALKEGAEFAAKQAAKEATQAVAKKVTKEAVEAAANKVAKEQMEKYSILFIKESGEELIEKSTRILIKEGAESLFRGTLKKSTKSIGEVYGNVFINKTSKAVVETTSTGVKNVAEVTVKKGFRSRYLGHKLKETVIQKELNDMMAKGPIELSPKELKYLRNNMDYANLKKFIAKYTGDKGNFIEFFVRLSQNNPKLVKELLENPTIRKKINSAIRKSSGGGVHEWLMTKNFEDFLLNPKWGEDGPFLSISLVKFVQKTSSVVYKKGGDHYSGTLFSKSFHDGLSKVIERSSSKEELFLNIKRYAKETLTKESYDDFIRIFTDVFRVNKHLV